MSPSAAEKAARIASNRARFSWRSASALASPGSATSLGMGSRAGRTDGSRGGLDRVRHRRVAPTEPGSDGGSSAAPEERQAAAPRRGRLSGPRSDRPCQAPPIPVLVGEPPHLVGDHRRRRIRADLDPVSRADVGGEEAGGVVAGIGPRLAEPS